MKPEERTVVTMEPLLLSAPDAAKALGISVDLLATLPVNRVRFGRRVLFPVDDLRDYIQILKVQSPA